VREETKLGLFARLWRAPWLLPAFGAASVATVVFLVRVLKDPEVVPGQRPLPSAELAEPVRAAPAPITAPAPEAEKAESVGDDADTSAKANGKARAGAPERATKGRGGKVGLPGAQSPARELRDGDLDRLARSTSETPRADKESPPEPARAKKKAAADLLGDRDGDIPVDRHVLGGMAKSRFAEPPPARPFPGTAEEASGMNRRQREGSNVRKPEAAPAAAAPASPSPARSAEAAPAAARALKDDDSDGRMAKRQVGPSLETSLEDSLHRADRLFADRHWSAAAEAYRDLLRRFPDHKDVGKWRTRMDQSLVAERENHQAPAAKAAKASQTTDDAKGARR
jgi:hypothetical protein